MSESILTEEEVRASIVPKSDQLNADDLVAGPQTFTITGVRRGDKEQPIIVDIEGSRPYKPCKTMRRILVAVFSDDPKLWVGQRVTLFCNPNVMWAGVKVGGIQISHMTGLKDPRTFMLTQSRSKRAEFTIYPLATLTPEEAAFIAQATKDIEGITTIPLLTAAGDKLKTKSDAVKAALKPVWAKRKKELTDADAAKT